MSTINVRIRSSPVPAKPCVEAVLARVAARRQPAVLDSTGNDEQQGRFTILAFDPVATLQWGPREGDPFEGMRDRLRCYADEIAWIGAAPTPGARTFPGGWIGYFAYEAGRFIERLPTTTTADVGLPLARFSLYDAAAIHDSRLGEWTIVTADLGSHSTPGRRLPSERYEQWLQLLTDARAPRPARTAPVAPSDPQHEPKRL